MRHSPGELRELSEAASDRLPVASPSVVFCEVEEGAVLLSTDQEAYYGLNAVGAKVWGLLPQHETLEGLCQALAVSYPEVNLGTLAEDVRLLLEDLRTSGLVVSA